MSLVSDTSTIRSIDVLCFKCTLKKQVIRSSSRNSENKKCSIYGLCSQFLYGCDKETGPVTKPSGTPKEQFFKVVLKVTGDFTQEPPNMNTPFFAFFDLLLFLFGISAGHFIVFPPASCSAVANLAENYSA